MAILITGGAGYIGSHTAIELIKNGLDVVIADDMSNASYVVMDRMKQITGRDVPLYPYDVCDKDKLKEVFDKNKIDAVIHFAGFKAVGESVSKPLKYYDNNLNATISLLEVMRQAGVKDIVFSSSATVYGVRNQPPLTEDMDTSAINPYGWTKVIIEQMLRDLYASDKSWNIILLRYFNPVGAHESGLIGEDPNGIPNNLTPFITQVLVGKRDELGVFGDDYDTPDGTCIRDYIHVLDLARGHVSALKYLERKPGCDIINLGTGQGSSVMDVILAFEKAAGKKVNYTIMGRRAGDAASSYADATKALKVLGWKAEKSLLDMCKDAWNWQISNPDGYKR